MSDDAHSRAGAPPARTALSDGDYQRESTAALARVEAACDAWLEGDVVDIDTHRTGGLLELTLPAGSKVVLNTQPPLQELWLAARGGGRHFCWSGGRWRDTRDGREFFDVLGEVLTEQTGRPLAP